MQSFQFSIIERLEGRTLLSHGADDPVIIADRTAISDDKALIQTHRHELELELGDDRHGILEAEHQRSLDAVPLRQKLIDDRSAGVAQLRDDKSALKSTLSADKVELKDDRNALKAHRSDDAQLAIDRTEFENDLAKYLTDLQSGKQLILQHKSDLATTLRDDRLVLVTFLHTDSAGMIAARQKYNDDLTSGRQRLEDDHNQLVEDRIKLRDDAKGMTSTPPPV